jgi:hypothetical protein
MRPIFTIHAGEYLVGETIERKFKNLHVWIPAKDTGIDLLITDKSFRQTISLQVKFSKDFHGASPRTEDNQTLVAGGWWNFDIDKIEESPADFWVLVLYAIEAKQPVFIVIPPKELAKKYGVIFRGETTIKSYLSIIASSNSKAKTCWEARGLDAKGKTALFSGKCTESSRDFSDHLENWTELAKLDKLEE